MLPTGGCESRSNDPDARTMKRLTMPAWRTTRRPSTSLVPLLLSAAAALAPAATADAKVTLADGHVDVGSARIVDGKLRSYVKDATGGRVVWRDPSTVVIRVVDRARVRLPSGMDFIGRRGQMVWMIPQVQKRGIIWAGWNTEEISGRQIRGGVGWKLRKVSGPGRVVLFQTGSFGDEDVLFNSGRGMPQTYTIPVGTHAHGNWAFTARGTYKMRFTMSIRTRGGMRQRDNATLTFKVG
jgi:putative ABC transporter-associated repeat protein